MFSTQLLHSLLAYQTSRSTCIIRNTRSTNFSAYFISQKDTALQIFCSTTHQTSVWSTLQRILVQFVVIAVVARQVEWHGTNCYRVTTHTNIFSLTITFPYFIHKIYKISSFSTVNILLSLRYCCCCCCSETVGRQHYDHVRSL